jgi:putative effector of murein hydrolase LrgA (UPF0299 family)
MTLIKLIAFIGEGALTFVVVIVATLRIHDAPELYGWRGLLALAVSTAAFAIVTGLGVWSVLYRLSTKAKRDRDAEAAKGSHELSLQPHTHDTGEVTR